MLYVRYESSVPNSYGEHTGIFGLANGLARSGRLGPSDYSWWRANNDWLNAAYPDPASADPTLFDKTKNPVVTCWFKSTAAHPLDRVPGYLSLLDQYGIPWTERRSNQPGHVLYHDDVQVVVAPFC
jgi:hypothetical protein